MTMLALRRRLFVMADDLDRLLDRLPYHERGRWHRHGQWGCRIGVLYHANRWLREPYRWDER